MAPSNQKKGKSRQPTVDPEGDNSGEQSGENDEQLVPSTSQQPVTTLAPKSLVPSSLPGFSEQQVHSMMGLFQNMLRTALQEHLTPQHFAPQHLSPQPYQQPLPSIEQPQPSHTNDSSSHTNLHQLRAEEVGYFDPKYQPEQQSTVPPGPVVNAGKYVYYRDVYVFVDRLKDLAS